MSKRDHDVALPASAIRMSPPLSRIQQMKKRDKATSRTTDQVGFWQPCSSEWSKRLWLPQQADSVTTDSVSSRPSTTDAGTRDSWFSVRQSLPKSSHIRSLPGALWHRVSPVEVAEQTVDVTKPVITGVKKVRFRPTPKQKSTIATWMGAARMTYNKAIAFLNNEDTVGSRTIKDVRAHCVNDAVTKNARSMKWARGVPYSIRDEGARDAMKAMQSNIAKQKSQKKQGKCMKFELRYRRKKRAFQETIVIHASHWGKKRGIYHALLGRSGDKLCISERQKVHIPKTLVNDIRLVRTRLGEFFLVIPTHESDARRVHDENQVTDEAPYTVAMDPGVRTFMTAYDASGRVVEWGAGDDKHLARIQERIQTIEERSKTVNHRKRYRMHRATLRANRKVRCLVDELHRKLALWLCRSFRTIIIPVFATQQMVTHKQGRTALRPKTSRAMCTWSHYRFRTNLKHKAKCFPGVSVVETTEQYTSKTCGACGQVNHNLREEKTFVCDACGFVCDRDFNAARNILIRYLTVKKIALS